MRQEGLTAGQAIACTLFHASQNPVEYPFGQRERPLMSQFHAHLAKSSPILFRYNPRLEIVPAQPDCPVHLLCRPSHRSKKETIDFVVASNPPDRIGRPLDPETRIRLAFPGVLVEAKYDFVHRGPDRETLMDQLERMKRIRAAHASQGAEMEGYLFVGFYWASGGTSHQGPYYVDKKGTGLGRQRATREAVREWMKRESADEWLTLIYVDYDHGSPLHQEPDGTWKGGLLAVEGYRAREIRGFPTTCPLE